MNIFIKEINNLIPELINIRQLLHQNAELSWQEKNTSFLIREITEKAGYEFQQIPGLETGGYVDLTNNMNAPFLAFRADIDGLPVYDDEALSYQSKHPGISHACGHDLHMAVGLGIMMLYQQVKDQFPYNIRIIFQPAEEPVPGGALACMETPVIENVKCIFAIHGEPSLPVGTISFIDGWVNVQTHSISFKFLGTGGHSARINKSNHLISDSSKFILEAIKHTESINHPDHPCILGFTKIESGDNFNVLPSEVKLHATLRATKIEIFQNFIGFISEYQTLLKKNQGITMQYFIRSGAPAVIISSEVYSKLLSIYNESLNNNFSLTVYRSLGGDDFGWYLTKLPGALIRIGMKDKLHQKSLHEEGFNANDEAIFVSLLTLMEIFNKWN